jgi:hypothetical protein
MRENRALLDVRNLGDFAFAMTAYGLVLALFSFVAGFFILELLAVQGRAYLALSSVIIWILLNVPVFQGLRQRSRLWHGEQRAAKQITYVELTSMAILAALSYASQETIGARELITVLEYLFSSWLLTLLACQVFLHLVLGYKILPWDAVKWSIMTLYLLLTLYTKLHS